MNILGKHLILDITLNDEITEYTVNSILEVVRRRLHVLKETSYEFEPYGLTYVCIISESHFTMHTYPEHNYLSMDLYICNEFFDIDSFERELSNLLDVREKKSKVFLRGEARSTLFEKEPQLIVH